MPAVATVQSDPRKRLLAHLALFAAAFAFGTTFVTVKSAVETADPLPFLTARFGLAAIALFPFIVWRKQRNRSTAIDYLRPATRSAVSVGGLCAGLALALGYVFQTVGLQHTSGTVSAFITYLLVIFVPLLNTLLTRRMPSRSVGFGVILATLGLFLLTGAQGGFGKGEVLTVGCALAFAVHILLLERLSPRHDVFELTGVQLLVVCLVCAVPGALSGGFLFPAVVWAAAIYTAIVASAMAFLLQTWAQRRVDPTRTALLLILEPVVAAVMGAAVTGDRLGWSGAGGATLILSGILMAAIGPYRERRIGPGAIIDEH